MISIIFTFFLIQLISAVPLPALITRVHTAEAVTQTILQTTGTTTVWLPPVGIYIIDGQTSTSTISDTQWNTYPVTFTSYINKGAESTPQQVTQAQAQPTSETQQQQQQPQPQPTTSQAAEPTTSQAPQPTTETQQTTQQTTQQQTIQDYTQETTQSSTSQSTFSTSTLQTTTSSSTTSSTYSTSETTSSSSPTSSSSGDISAPSSIVYSPYADDRNCKQQNVIYSDLELIASKGIKHIRSYGTDCGALTSVLSKCKELGIKVNQGVWISQDGVDSIDNQIQDLIKYGQSNGWDIFDFITIGNEAINSNFCSISDLKSKISSTKSKLQQAGYNGWITTSEPPATFINHPELCSADIDFIGINPHSYFNENISPENAGNYIVSQKNQVAGICNKNVEITETGYPSQGVTLGLNTPSPANQKIAIDSIIKETGGDVTILTTYNDFWKDPGPYGIEQYFGVIQLFS
ncbi:unnamed protein product [Candida verbasci]|uniref:Family 17 glucosidase SCW11 n=1 Tax=Candida verbasci TaxID=1227364 RepID=A0A9W4U139_9ASCO|nr:unnamed protein product [Candida verbasci]